MYAEIIVNIEAPLEGTFHYHVPRDLRRRMRVGQLVEVEFGRRLAQGVVIDLSATLPIPIDETKPIINIIESKPVVLPWQIRVARWMSVQYLAPLNGCIRLFLPPGMTRWADVTVDINPYWDGDGRLTDIQENILEILREKGDLRGKQLRRALPKSQRKKWQTAVNQLAKRDIVRKATILDPPRAKPKKIRTAELIAGPKQITAALPKLGRKNKQADILYFLYTSKDPIPSEAMVLSQSGATEEHLQGLAQDGLVTRLSQKQVEVKEGRGEKLAIKGQAPQKQTTSAPAETPSQTQKSKILQPAAVSLAIPHKQVRDEICSLKGATTYDDILDLLAAEARPVNISDIYKATGSNLNHLRKLAKLDLIKLGSEEVWRDPLADRDFTPAEPPMLTSDQARVWGRVKMALIETFSEDDEEEEIEGIEIEGIEIEAEEGGDNLEPYSRGVRPFLLHGVTGSGKTEIYMRAIDYALEQERQAIVLVPEIALTSQTVRRFAARFPGRVAVLHSRLTDGERYDTWRRAAQGLFDIVVGPRSALFTPFPNLGVIIVDEEHDHSYKQTPPIPPPYYHARDLAIHMGDVTNAIVIMGSATPDLVTYHRAKAERYQLLELPRRVMGHRQRIASQEARLNLISQYQRMEEDPDDALTIPLPPINIVDLRQELRAGNRSIFSRLLQEQMDETLARGEQAILFLNRRGTNSFVICRDCGHTMECPNCDIPLTYHRPDLLLTCHHCGYKEQQPQECPACGSKRIKYFGLGTEQLEELVRQRWPEARITRWDTDTTAGRDTHENLLASFINHESDILVGTQMIAKGLDLPMVTLVGVISADVSLGMPDYRTGERAFQLLAQVAGRAGRGLLGGRVILQTYQPEHYAIQAAADHDFISFYLDEIRFRTQHGLPPFRRLAKLVYADPRPQTAEKEARKVADALKWHILEKHLSATEILGPQPPFFSRIDRRYRWQIIIRSPDPVRLLEDFPIPPRWVVDIDPVSTL